MEKLVGTVPGGKRVLVVNGNGRRDPFNPIYLRPVHPVHELPGEN